MQNYRELTVSALYSHKEKRQNVITGITTIGTYIIKDADLTPRKLVSLCMKAGILQAVSKGTLAVKPVAPLTWDIYQRSDNRPVVRLTASTRTMQGL